MHLEKDGLVPVGGKAFGKFGAIIRLDSLNRAGEGFHKADRKNGFHIHLDTPAGMIHLLVGLRNILWVRVMVRPSGEAAEEPNGAVKAPFPAINVLPVSFIFDGSLRNLIFLSIYNKYPVLYLPCGNTFFLVRF